jgi:CHAT domain-containing protein/tetratricopeptide (TPR) repeat protein
MIGAKTQSLWTDLACSGLTRVAATLGCVIVILCTTAATAAGAKEPVECNWHALEIGAQGALDRGQNDDAEKQWANVIDCIKVADPRENGRTHLSYAYSSYGEALRKLARYDEALSAYQTAMDLARSPGADVNDLARATGGIGTVYYAKGEVARGEVKLVEALSIIPKYKRDDTYISLTGEITRIYRQTKRPREAADRYLELITFFEENIDLYSEHIAYYESYRDLARSYVEMSQFVSAEATIRKAIQIAIAQEKRKRETPTEIGRLMKKDPELFDQKARSGASDASGAEEYVSPSVTEAREVLAELYLKTHHINEAESLLRDTIAAYGAIPKASVGYLGAVRLLSEILADKGECSDVQRLLEEQIRIIEQELGHTCPGTCTLNNDLAFAFECEGRYSAAFEYLERAAEEMEELLGHDNFGTLTTKMNLAALLLLLDRTEDALAIVQDVRRQLVHNIDQRRASLMRSGLLLEAKIALRHGDATGAIAMVQGAVADLAPSTSAADIEDLASLESELGRFFVEASNWGDAKTWYERALTDLTRIGLGESLAAAEGLQGIAIAEAGSRTFSRGDTALAMAIAIGNAQLPRNHPNIAALEASLGAYDIVAGKIAEAEPHLKRAVQIFRDRGWLLGLDEQGEVADEFRQAQQAYNAYLDYLLKRMADEPASVRSFSSTAFEISQLVRVTTPSEALLMQSIERTEADPARAARIRERRDFLIKRVSLEAEALTMVKLPNSHRNRAAEARTFAAIATANVRIAAIGTELGVAAQNRESELNPQPLSIAEIQDRLLGPREALLVYVIEDWGTGVWVVRKTSSVFRLLSEGRTSIAVSVVELRRALSGRLPLQFDVGLARTVFNSLVAPVMVDLDGAVDHTFVVTDGLLQILPMGVLVASTPPDERWKAGDYRGLDWLARHFVFSMLPSVNALKIVRDLPVSHADVELLGVGTPNLGSRSSVIKGDHRVILREVGGIADRDAIAQLTPLDELLGSMLQELARAFGMGSKWPFIYEGDQATEAAVRGLKLDRFRTIVFVTHGLSEDRFSNEPVVAEAALVLTPPQREATTVAANDGLLTASEIGALHLDANVVLLIACNTASGSDTRGAEAFAGLAKAFFLAGARSVVASYWNINAQAAETIVSAAARRLRALRSASFGQAINDAAMEIAASDEQFSHPYFWAPFIVVGDGSSPYLPFPAAIPSGR